MSEVKRWVMSTGRALRQQKGGGSAILRRRYEESLEDVWSACTDRERLGRWFGDVRGALRLGETVVVGIGQPETARGAIVGRGRGRSHYRDRLTVDRRAYNHSADI